MSLTCDHNVGRGSRARIVGVDPDGWVDSLPARPSALWLHRDSPPGSVLCAPGTHLVSVTAPAHDRKEAT